MGRLSTPADTDPELASLRERISSLDRELLAALNRRLELVLRVQELKRQAGAPTIDAGREAEQFELLASENTGPLTTVGVTSVFAAVLDVMKQEARPAPQPERPVAQAPRTEVTRLAVVGTGLLGTSVALAARRAGVSRVAGWDADDGTLAEASGGGAVESTGSLEEAVAGAELVVVAAPVGALPAAVRHVLAAAPDATVTDVGSTKRTLAAIDDPRFVAGHPLAGGATGGPARAAADLFDGGVRRRRGGEHEQPRVVEATRLDAELGALAERAAVAPLPDERQPDGPQLPGDALVGVGTGTALTCVE